jgi:hypothetical protein
MRLTIDTMSLFPEWDATGIKANLGAIDVQVVDAAGRVQSIRRLKYVDYAQPAYEANAGILDIPISEEMYSAIEKGQLRFALCRPENPPFGRSFAEVALAEQDLRAFGDLRGIYLDQGETRSVSVRVLERGKPAPEGTLLLCLRYEWNHKAFTWSRVRKSSPSGVAPPPLSQHSQTDRPISSRNVVALQTALRTFDELPSALQVAAPFVEVTDKMHPRRDVERDGAIVDAEGKVTLELTAGRPGCCDILLLPFRNVDFTPHMPDEIDLEGVLNVIKFADLLVIRVLPFDNDFGKMSDYDLTWDRIRNEVLLPYILLQPITCSGKHKVRLDNETELKHAARRVLQRLRPEIFNQTDFMPVTRDLSAGKRTALVRWLQNSLLIAETTNVPRETQQFNTPEEDLDPPCAPEESR